MPGAPGVAESSLAAPCVGYMKEWLRFGDNFFMRFSQGRNTTGTVREEKLNHTARALRATTRVTRSIFK
jgi:hypothetical protein